MLVRYLVCVSHDLSFLNIYEINKFVSGGRLTCTGTHRFNTSKYFDMVGSFNVFTHIFVVRFFLKISDFICDKAIPETNFSYQLESN